MKLIIPIVIILVCIDSVAADAQPRAYQAIATDSVEQSQYIGIGADKTEASLRALNRCEEAHSPQKCEIIRIGSTTITTAQEIKANTGPNTPLMMWENKNRRSQISIVGSVHSLKATLLPLPNPIDQAFEQSSHVVVETNVLQTDDGSTSRAWLLDQLTLAPEQSLRSMLTDQNFEQLQKIVRDTGLKFETLNRLKPAFAATNIVNARIEAFGFSRKWGMEQQFLERADSRTIVSLETTKQQIKLLAQTAMDIQLRILRESLVSDTKLESMVTSLVSAWWQGDDVAIENSFQDNSENSRAYKKFQRDLLDKRNFQMAAKIMELLDLPGHYFVLVGAAHLTGSNSIINILQERGITLKRVAYDGSMQINENLMSKENYES